MGSRKEVVTPLYPLPWGRDDPRPKPWSSLVKCFLSFSLPQKVRRTRLHHPGWLEIPPGVGKPLLPESQRPLLGAPSPSTNKTRGMEIITRHVIRQNWIN